MIRIPYHRESIAAAAALLLAGGVPSPFAGAMQARAGEEAGICVRLEPKVSSDGYPVVRSVLPQAGADVKAGLRKGDRIARVDGKPTRNKKLDQVTKMLRGPEGSSVRLEMLRTGSKPLAVVVKRRLMRPE